MHMFNATSKVQEKAISKETNTIRHINDQSEYIKMFAIKQGCLLKYIKEPDFSMKIEAIMINPINIIYIDDPDMSLLDLAFTCGAYSLIEESLETNNCEKSKATLEALNDRQYYLLKKDMNNKNCTIS